MRSVFLVLTLFLMGYSFSYLSLEKPWEKQGWEEQNPFITHYANGDEWASGLFDRSISSLNLEAVDVVDIKDNSIKTKILNARKYSENLELISEECFDLKKQTLSSYENLNRSDFIFSCWYNRSIERYSTFLGVNYFFLYPPTLDLVFCGWDASKLDTQKQKEWETQKNQHLESIIECSNQYRKYWKITMSSAIDALSESSYYAERTWEDAESSFEKIAYAGVCKYDYRENEREECQRLSDVFQGISLNLTTNSGGNYVKLKNELSTFSDQLSGVITDDLLQSKYQKLIIAFNITLNDQTKEKFVKSLSKYVPDAIGYHSLTGQIWGEDGTVANAISVKESADDLLLRAKEKYLTKDKLAKNKLNKLRKDLVDLDTQEVTLITESAYINGTIKLGTGQRINSRFEKINSDLEEINNALDFASTTYLVGENGYLKNATNKVSDLLEKITNIEDQVSELNQDSVAAVNSKHGEALVVLAEFESVTKNKLISPEINSLYEDGKNEIERGKEGTLGSRFYHYSNAYTKLKTAKNFFLEKPVESIAFLKAELVRLRKLVVLAEKDDIEASFESSLLNLILENPQSWMGGETTDNLVFIEQSIIKKAKIKWRFLEDKRQNLLQEILLGGDSLNDLKTSMKLAEKIIFDENGKIIWLDAIGMLKQLNLNYVEIAAQITEKERSLITKNGLIINYELFVGDVELESPTEIALEIYIKNRYPYQVENLVVDVDNDIPFLEGNVVKGKDLLIGIAQEGPKLLLYLKKVIPYGSYELSLVKNQTIAYVVSNKTKTYASVDGSASVIENITFTLDYDVSSFSLPDEAELENSKIDGMSFTRSLEKGLHTLLHEHTIHNAFSVDYSNQKTKKEFLKTTIQYDLTFSPNVDISELLFFIDEPIDANSFAITSLGWEKVADKTNLGNGVYSFKILNLKKGKPATFQISYYVKNESSYLDKELSLIAVQNLSNQAKIIYDEITAIQATNDTINAITKLELLKSILKKENSERIKLSSEYSDLVDAITKEENMLEASINSILSTGLDTPVLGLLLSRQEFLNKSLEVASKKEFKDGIATLEGIDRTWLKKQLSTIKKIIFDEYNINKKVYLNLTNTLHIYFSDFEQAYSRLEASNSVEDLSAVLTAQKKINALIETERLNQSVIKKEFVESFTSLNPNITRLLSKYAAEEKAAKGTKFSLLFDQNLKDVQKRLKETENNINKGASIPELQYALYQNQEDAKSLSQLILILEDEAKQMVHTIENALKNTTLSEDDKNSVNQQFLIAKNALANKSYVDSLKASEKAFTLIKNPANKNDNAVLLLGLTALFIIGVIIIYLLKLVRQPHGERTVKKQYRELAKAK